MCWKGQHRNDDRSVWCRSGNACKNVREIVHVGATVADEQDAENLAGCGALGERILHGEANYRRGREPGRPAGERA